MSNFPRGGFPEGLGGFNAANMFGGGNPMDMLGQGGLQGLANLMGGGGGGQGLGGLSEMLGGGFNPSALQGMSEEDQRAVLAAMQEEGGVSNANPAGLGNIAGLGGQLPGGLGAGNFGQLSGGLGMGNFGQLPGGLEMGNFGGVPDIQSQTTRFSREIQSATDAAVSCQDPYAAGMNTIFVLDTSESMRGTGITQAKEAVESLMAELENISMETGLEENLCLITCGSVTATTVGQHLTNDYQLIRQALARVTTSGSTPLQLAVSMVIGAAQRAQPETVHSHVLNPRVIILSDGHATNSFNLQGNEQESQSEATSQQETPGVINVIQTLISSHCMRVIYVPVGNADGRFSSGVEGVQGAHIVLAGDVRSLASYHMQQRVTAEVKEKKKGGQAVTKETVKVTAQSQYPSLQDRDFDAIMVQMNEPNTPGEFQARYSTQSMPGGSGMGTGAGGMPQGGGFPGGFPGMQGMGGGNAGSMPFQMPGQMGGMDGAEGQGEEAEAITQEKINELLEKYGGGPPKKDNLPLPLRPGIRVRTGPNWMWRMNGVEDNAEGVVVESVPDEENPTGEFDGWIRVKWDCGKEEDYRFGLDYEFDIEPIKGGMDAVEWPPGKERIFPEEEDLSHNDDEDFVETMRRLISKGGNPPPTSGPGSAGWDPHRRDPSEGPQEINFINPAHAEEYRRIMEQKRQEREQAAAAAAATQSAATPQTSSSQGATGPTQASASQTIHSRNGAQSQSSSAQGKSGAGPSATATKGQTGVKTTEGATAKTTSAASSAGTASKKNTSEDEVCYVWQYYTEQGDWRSYPPDIQKRVESEYLKRKNKGSIVIDLGNGSERIIFKSMEQRNVEKQIIRPVRRVEADAEKLRELQEMWSAN